MSKALRSVSSLATAAELTKKYEEAVKTLNTLQSNAQTLEKIRQQRDKVAHLNVPNMIKFAERAGITLEDIDKLSVIHVSGTKGKGSTCAFCESILRHHGYRTGFFSSPHLVEVRERFRINGQPLSREKFAGYFWEVYNKLEDSKVLHNDTMPAYFAFLTVMAFHVFMKEKIDVAIVEVGIGGQYDSTNLIHKPIVCGVASLGLDHISILGNTIDKIAWHKGGIFKTGVPAVTVPQPPAALKTLQGRALEIGTPLGLAPPLQDFETQGRKVKLGISGAMQRVNASLAVQLCKIWLESKQNKQDRERETFAQQMNVSIKDSEIPMMETFTLPQYVLNGLGKCTWAGRNQTLKKPGLTYYLDGAHTVESIKQCVEWFQESSKEEAKHITGKVVKVLLFNTTGDRDTCLLIDPLVDCKFDAAAFCPNIAFLKENVADLTNFMVPKETQMNKVLLNMRAWERTLMKRRNSVSSDVSHDSTLSSSSVSTSSKMKHKHENCSGEMGHDPCEVNRKILRLDNDSDVCDHNVESADNDIKETKYVMECDVLTKDFPCIQTALQWVTQGKETCLESSIENDIEIPDKLKNSHIQVLVTGSLHLVGGILSVVGPNYD